MTYVWWFEDDIELWSGIIVFKDLWLKTMDKKIMCMIHKFRFWLGTDSNLMVYKLTLPKELIRISCFYDSEVYHWFHSYFERLVYAYWKKYDLWRVVDHGFRQNGSSVKNKDYSISESFMERSIIRGSHVGKRSRCVRSISLSFQYNR